MVKSSASGSGPSRAMPSMSAGSRTTYSARLLRVPASVTSSPAPLSSTIRAASGDLLFGRAGSAGTSSFQRTQPARARCSTRWVPETSMSRNLPCRVTPSTMPPASAVMGGS